MRIVIDDIPESLNKVLRMHWAARKRYADRWANLVRHQVVPCRKRKRKMQVAISQIRPRLLDNDNLVGGCKHIVDTLVHLGILYDDAPEWVKLDYYQQTGRAKTTVIEISEAEV